MPEVHPLCCLDVLLFNSLVGNEVHPRPDHGFTDGFGIDTVVLVTLNSRLDEPGRNQGETSMIQFGPIGIGISACLLGHPVRYNGKHKLSSLCTETLTQYFQFHPICPEEAIGLGTPRPPIHLVGDPTAPRVIGVENSSLDVTDALHELGQRTAETRRDISGFILMQKSPSCGMQGVKVMANKGNPTSSGAAGAFANALMRARPELPVEEEGRLADPVLLENFISRVYVHAHWWQLQHEGLTRKGLLTFHQRYKYLLMATHREQYVRLGRAVAQSSSTPLEVFAPTYFRQLMQALKQPATRGTHFNVLQHLAGYLKRHLDKRQKQELQQLFSRYRLEEVPLAAPIALLKQHFSRHTNNYIAGQAYLQPHPEALGLYNAI